VQTATGGGLGVLPDDDVDVVPEIHQEVQEAVDREEREATNPVVLRTY
jgi:hypothetical protein